ncbi:Uncharacterised protein [Leclercia adecarboxylata]|uniref:Uncharacterized protein n=1 Tax=Leclercia adecarboxylata TaxID=83655 RepID=A0A4U9HGF8_9ENTR|nr:Uncharacterised protein [Leclercia adecarboxylata]
MPVGKHGEGMHEVASAKGLMETCRPGAGGLRG